MKKFNFNSEKIKLLLNEIYLIVMSLILLSLFFYYRIFMKRLEYSLEILKLNLTIKYLIISFFFFLLQIIILCVALKHILIKKREVSKMLFHLIRINEILIYKPLNYTITKISPYIPYSGTLIINYCYFFRKNTFRLFLAKTLCFMFYFFPRILMALIFVIEIIFFHQIKYFIMCILVFIIPYIYLLFLNLSEKFYEYNMPTVEESIYVTPLGLPNAHGVFSNHDFKLRENTGYTKEDLPDLKDAWDVLFYILNLNAIMRKFISDLSSYITLFTSFCYCLALGYKLYYFILF